MRRFIERLMILLLLVSVLTLGINYMYMSHRINYGTMGEQRNDSSYIQDVPDGIQVCDVGNSHSYYAFNYKSFEEDYVCYNFALPSQSMSYNYRILRNYRDKIKPGAIVMIGVSYPTFFGEVETDDPDFASKNKRYYHFLRRDLIKEYDYKTDIFVRYLPALSTPLLDLIKTTIGRGQSPDLWNGVTNKEEATAHGISRYERHVLANVGRDGKRIYNEEEIQSVNSIIELCRELKATPVLVTTPYLTEYTQPIMDKDPAFYKDFYGVIDRIKEETGVEYYDYAFDERFVNRYEWFLNSDHLNKVGAEEFTGVLMEEVVEDSVQRTDH